MREGIRMRITPIGKCMLLLALCLMHIQREDWKCATELSYVYFHSINTSETFLIHIQREVWKCATELPIYYRGTPYVSFYIQRKTWKKCPRAHFSLYIQRQVLKYATELSIEMKGGKQENISKVSRKKWGGMRGMSGSHLTASLGCWACWVKERESQKLLYDPLP